MATRRRPLCSDVSRANSESLAATASRIDHWLLVEYRALWPRQPLFVICTHGKRDRCCAVYGRPLYDAARDELEDYWVWQASHVGGDRFAGNLLAFPHGLYFGRVEPNEVSSLLAVYRAGRVPLERYRGRCAYTFAEQAAERALREKLSLAGIDDLELAASSREGDRWRIAFGTREGARHEQTVVTELGEPAYLTCDAKTPQRPRHFTAVA